MSLQYDRSASPPPTPAEDRRDRARLKALAAAVEARLHNAHVDLDGVTLWRDRYRLPLGFGPGPISIGAQHFDAVRACGGDLVVADDGGSVFDDDDDGANNNTQGFYVEMRRTRLRGLQAWPPRARRLCLAATALFGAAVYYLWHVHVEPFLRH